MYYEIIDNPDFTHRNSLLYVKPCGITNRTVTCCCTRCGEPSDPGIMDEVRFLYKTNANLVAERTELSAERDKVKETLRILHKHVEHLENLLEKHERRVCQNV